MTKSAVVHARIEPETKKKAEEVLSTLGLTPTEAIRLFYHQISLRGGLPFNILIPNEKTARTLDKSYRGEEVETFESPEEMFESWNR
ncbi:MAG: type II toxin-antitoxin system RelB/DinJ family antitoxin [Candidatus Omnitrophica bacterium]|nr:type II toxin-antitoxin system RelB/DinJ family antitoxin [Candidatus Omnitrophota bacterium]MCA9428089.1 type II toxin-antitoxin system RelB/DinJ family antitoxin [Candidatus Omnitrophota bacterium]MCA9449708.1 type II toxin-antitoxin system RelB/DinJ family antitoxin [Candidatus Omnitrophota bacterium]